MKFMSEHYHSCVLKYANELVKIITALEYIPSVLSKTLIKKIKTMQTKVDLVFLEEKER